MACSSRRDRASRTPPRWDTTQNGCSFRWENKVYCLTSSPRTRRSLMHSNLLSDCWHPPTSGETSKTSSERLAAPLRLGQRRPVETLSPERDERISVIDSCEKHCAGINDCDRAVFSCVRLCRGASCHALDSGPTHNRAQARHTSRQKTCASEPRRSTSREADSSNRAKKSIQ